MDPSQQYEAYMMAPEGQVQAGGAEPQHNNLIINYIPSNLSEADVRNLFAPYGTVVHCKLVLDKITGALFLPHKENSKRDYSTIPLFFRRTGTSAGYGFVKYVDDESAMKAITQLNGFQLHGKTLKVSLARPMHQKNEKTTLYVAGMPSAWSKADFEHILSQFGTVTESKLLLDSVGMSRGVGFITLDSVQGATAALSLNGTQPPGCEKPIQVKVLNQSPLMRRIADLDFPGIRVEVLILTHFLCFSVASLRSTRFLRVVVSTRRSRRWPT
jgi:RNA recognition motif-containing protein